MKQTPNWQKIVGRTTLVLFSVLVTFSLNARAQSSTTTARTPGTPAGSYQLGDADTINLFTGNLNYSLPLLLAAGRGEAQAGIGVAIEGQWDIQVTQSDPPNQYTFHEYLFRSPNPVALVGSVRLDISFINTNQPCSGGNFYVEYRVGMVYVEPNGTEHSMRDNFVHGMAFTTCGIGSQPLGRIFQSTSGNFVTYVNDTSIYSSCYGVSGCTNNVDGYLYFRNGVKSRVVGGYIQWIQDRNGNKIEYTYEPQQYSKRLLQITDSIGRTVNVDYNVNEPQPYGLCTRLRFKGFGQQEKIIRISYESDLGAVLRTTQPGDPTAPIPIVYDDPTDDVGISYQMPGLFIRAVWLPDGRGYQFKYNVLGQLARVVLPTGGALEYDFADVANLPFNSSQGGVPTITNSVSEKRVYSTNNVLVSKTVFSNPTSYTSGVIPPSRGGVVRDLDVFEPDGTRLAKTRHYFYGLPENTYGLLVPWWHGKEFRTEAFALNGSTLLRVSDTTWGQSVPSWCYTVWPCYSNPADLAPTNNPVMLETKSTLADGNLVSKTSAINPSDLSWAFDSYNNQTDVWQYGFGIGQPGALLNHLQTSYINNANPLNGIYLLGLTGTMSIYEVGANGAETLAASSQTLYDEYSLLTYETVTGWQDPGSFRGNPTTVKRWLNTNNSWIETNAQFDQLGNVRKSWDELDRLSEVGYVDAFTDNVNRNTFAFATQSKSPIPDNTNVHSANASFVSTAVFDYWSGLVKTSTDVNSQTVTLEYNDVLDRLTKVINPPGGGWTSYEYGDVVGNLYVKTTTAFDNSRNIQSYKYFDGLGRIVRSFTPKAGGIWIIADTQYDASARTKRISKPYQGSSLNAPVNPANNWVSTEYDSIGRVTKTQTADGSESQVSYLANTATFTDADLKKRKTETDALGRLTRVVESPDPGAANLETNYKYDVLGNLRRVEQGAQRRYYKYDSLSRMVRSRNSESEINPDLVSSDPIAENDQWSTGIDYLPNGSVSAKTDARGIRIDYLYDDLNRPHHRSFTATRSVPAGTYSPSPAVDIYYDGRGLLSIPDNSLAKLTMVSSSVSETRYTNFDAMGRVTSSEQRTHDQTYQMPSYTYNFAGALTSQIYPSGRVVQNSFDDAGSLSTVTGQAPSQPAKTYASNFDYSLTDTGATSRLQLGNGRWERVIYNKRLQPILIGLGTAQGSTDVIKLEYGYGTTNNNGNTRTQTITIPTVGNSPGFTAVQTYGYDELNRLTSAIETTGGQTNWQQSFTHDQFGNRSVVTNATTTALIGDNPQISAGTTTNRITPQTGEYYQYDATGNLIKDRVGNAYSFDGENNQTAFTAPGAGQPTAQYFYDGDGRRVKKVLGNDVTVFVYGAQGQLVAEYASNSQPVTNQTTYVTCDKLGTPRVNTSQSGSVLARHDYLPYGEELIGYGGRGNHAEYTVDSVRQKFTGLERDPENGLDYAQARYYASKAGRFISVDPYDPSVDSVDQADFEEYLSQPQKWNRYVYVINNPFKYVDRLGEDLALTGTEAQQKEELQRIRKLLGEDRFKLVDYNQRNIAGLGNVTIVDFGSKENRAKFEAVGSGNPYEKEFSEGMAEIIGSKDIVEYRIAESFNVKDCWGSWCGEFTQSTTSSEFGGAATVNKDESLTGNVQIFVSPNAHNQAAWAMAKRKELGFKISSDGDYLDFTPEQVDAHEFGHGYNSIKWGMRVEHPDRALRWENILRHRQGSTNTRLLH